MPPPLFNIPTLKGDTSRKDVNYYQLSGYPSLPGQQLRQNQATESSQQKKPPTTVPAWQTHPQLSMPPNMVQSPAKQTQRNNKQPEPAGTATRQRILRGRLGSRKRTKQTPLLWELSRQWDPRASWVPSLCMWHPRIRNQALPTDNWPTCHANHQELKPSFKPILTQPYYTFFR